MNASHPTFLRRVLLADATTCALMSLLLLSAGNPLVDLLGLPASLLDGVGAILLPFAALVAYLATRSTIPRAGVWIVILSNALWAVDSFLLLRSSWVEPTNLGRAFVIVQALATVTLAELEYVGLRKAATVS